MLPAQVFGFHRKQLAPICALMTKQLVPEPPPLPHAMANLPREACRFASFSTFVVPKYPETNLRTLSRCFPWSAHVSFIENKKGGPFKSAPGILTPKKPVCSGDVIVAPHNPSPKIGGGRHPVAASATARYSEPLQLPLQNRAALRCSLPIRLRHSSATNPLQLRPFPLQFLL